MSPEAWMEVEGFFLRDPAALPIVSALLETVSARFPTMRTVVQKSQVGLWENHPFAALWLGPRRKTDHGVMVSVFLDRRLEHPRLVQAVEPYPGRWTRHLLLHSEQEVDEDLFSLLGPAHKWAMRR